MSNAGSLLGLLSYPALVEPDFTTRHQAIGWSLAYGAFVALCALIAFRQTPVAAPISTTETSAANRAAAPPDWKLQLLWLALAADASAPCSPSRISQNVARGPAAVDCAPLSLYLLSLILCFADRSLYGRFLFLRLLAVALGGMAYALSPDFANAGPLLQVPLFCAGLFICCMVCHGELAKLKPPPEHLTLFYLMVLAGGALGGIFVGVIAPHIFRGYYELPMAMAGCGHPLLVVVLHRDPAPVFREGWRSPVLLAVGGLTALLVVSLCGCDDAAKQSESACYGAQFLRRLARQQFPATADQPARRELYNGTIIHGLMILAADRRTQPTTYYGPRSGAGLALASARDRGNVHVGIVGLGAGTLASNGQSRR